MSAAIGGMLAIFSSALGSQDRIAWSKMYTEGWAQGRVGDGNEGGKFITKTKFCIVSKHQICGNKPKGGYL